MKTWVFIWRPAIVWGRFISASILSMKSHVLTCMYHTSRKTRGSALLCMMMLLISRHPALIIVHACEHTHTHTNCYSSCIHQYSVYFSSLPGGSVVKNLPANTGDVGLIPRSGRSPEEGNGNPPQYSCLGNPRDRGAWLGYSPWGWKRVGHNLVTRKQHLTSIPSKLNVIELHLWFIVTV